MKAINACGFCLPANCETNSIESALNDLIRAADNNNTILKILAGTCQREEFGISWKAIDYVTM